MTSAQQAATTAFWQWLAAHASRLPHLVDGESPFWDEVLAALKHIDNGLWLELTTDADPGEVVITAGGDPDLFDLVDAISAQAPPLPGWQAIPLKRGMGFGFSITWEGVPLDPKQLWFEPLNDPDRPDIVGLRVAAPGHHAGADKDYGNGVLMLLDTALGEREAVRDIELLEVVAPPTDPDAEGYLPLVELANYIAWRRKRPASQIH